MFVDTYVTRLLATNESWTPALSLDGLIVYILPDECGGQQAIRLSDDAGVILGTLFRSGESSGEPIGSLVTTPLSAKESRAITQSQGKQLVAEYWGSYVAIYRSREEPRISILRSPLGRIPCAWSHLRDGVRMFFSSLQHYLAITSGHSLSVNWQFVAAMLRMPGIQEGIGIKGVSWLRSGENLALLDHCERLSRYWDPIEIATAQPIRDMPRAVEAARATTRSVVRAWASGHKSVLAYLSGGLDSSIVVACMKGAQQAGQVTCLNYYSEGSDTDEREWARAVAARAEVELVEFERSAQVDLSEMTSAHITASPMSYSDSLELNASTATMAREKGATAVMTGHYGDELFFKHAPVLALADYFIETGLTRDLPKRSLHVARLEEKSVWRVLRESAPWKFRDGKKGATTPDLWQNSLVNLATVDDLLRSCEVSKAGSHSYRSLPPGKRLHIQTITGPASHEVAFSYPNAPEELTPLLSQPLVELCLRIPTYVHSDGGWDRAVARQAFQEDLPREIFYRRSKGGQEEHAYQLLMHNRDFLRELLSDGVLVQQGILNREKVLAMFSPQPSAACKGMADAYTCINLEVWLQILKRSGVSVAA